MDELEKLAAEKKTPSASGDKPEEKIDEELKKKEEHKANLDRAIAEGNAELKRLRDEKKQLKPKEEEIPKIDMEDPSSKAWDRHINEKVNPVQLELDKEKEEVRTFALQEFLADKPALAANPEKVKEMVSLYEKIRTATERNKEGVLIDLERAYAATFPRELINAAKTGRIEKVQADILSSDIAVSRGATAYPAQHVRSPQLSEDDKAILAKWGMTPEEWQDDVKNHSGK